MKVNVTDGIRLSLEAQTFEEVIELGRLAARYEGVDKPVNKGISNQSVKTLTRCSKCNFSGSRTSVWMHKKAEGHLQYSRGKSRVVCSDCGEKFKSISGHKAKGGCRPKVELLS